MWSGWKSRSSVGIINVSVFHKIINRLPWVSGCALQAAISTRSGVSSFRCHCGVKGETRTCLLGCGVFWSMYNGMPDVPP